MKLETAIEKFDMDFEDLIESAMKKPDFQTKMPQLHDFLLCVMGIIEKAHPEKYEKLYLRAFIIFNGWHFDQELAAYAVDKFGNKDPKNPKGEYWTFEEASSVAQKNGITFTNFTDADWYFTMNMMRSDYFDPEMPEDEYKYYMQLSKDFLMDSDTESTGKSGGKAMRYWVKVGCWKPDMKK